MICVKKKTTTTKQITVCVCFGCTNRRPLVVFVMCREPIVYTAYAWHRCSLMITVVWCLVLCPPCRISTAPVHASAASSSLLSPPSMTSTQVPCDLKKQNKAQPIHSVLTCLCAFLFIFFKEDLTPPLELLQMIVLWIQEDPRLVLITFLNSPLSGSQPITSLDVTPLGGLVRWCIKAPLVYGRDKKQALTNGSSENEPEAGPLFSALHLSVLQVCVCLDTVSKRHNVHIEPLKVISLFFNVLLLLYLGLYASAHHTEREGALWSPGTASGGVLGCFDI